jgi:drug/metabolite transporter (DMT)-like permease
VGLLAYVAVTERRRTLRAFRAIGTAGVGVAVCAAVSSAAFLVALNHATVANVLFWQALAPIFAAVAGTLLGDPVQRRTWLAMAVAVAGVAVMAGGPGHSSPGGQALSFFVSVSFAGVIVIARHRRDVSMAPAMCLSQVLVVVCAAPFASVAHAGARDATLLALLGLTQIGLGFVFLTIGSRLIPAGEVALITLLEVVLGPAWVWVFLAERPSTATLVGGAVVMTAVVLETSDRGAVVRVARRG